MTDAGTIIDLDALVPADKKVTLKGQVYTVPGDMPMTVFLKMQKAAALDGAEDITDEQLADAMIDPLWELFTYQLAADAVEARAKLRRDLETLGLGTYVKILPSIYGKDAEPDEDEEGPTQPSELDGTTNTSPTLAAVPATSGS